MNAPLRAPFPYFGGKSTVAELIWQRFGNVPNYVEPFFGSGAVLLGRPHAPGTETINDADHMVANFWRAVQADPDAVCVAMDWPVNETDLSARHYWLVTEGRARLAKLHGDPLGYDTQVAGWWCHGICAWIGSGWCSGTGPWQWVDGEWRKRGMEGVGVHKKRPHSGNAGMGINSQAIAAPGISKQLPHLWHSGMGVHSPTRHPLQNYVRTLSDRLRRVRVACGDWSRVCGPSVTFKQGLTGVFLDPPYSAEAGRDNGLYAVECITVAHDARAWAIENGSNPLMRICLAGYDTEHAMPDGWANVAWKANGGYGSQGDADGTGRANSARETLWFSPHCLAPVAAQFGMDFMMETRA